MTVERYYSTSYVGARAADQILEDPEEDNAKANSLARTWKETRLPDFLKLWLVVVVGARLIGYVSLLLSILYRRMARN